ncbi:MAG TPA: peptidylprolyl isomerase [Nitrospiria bacterium]|nr:peptidylprolyl isomerase [Nitrospiria bacterium]
MKSKMSLKMTLQWTWILSLSLAALPLGLDPARGESAAGAKLMTVSAGEEISIEYTLKLEDKTTVDSNVGGEPFKFIQGEHQVVPGLETALEGLKVGDKKTIKVVPKDGYGEVDPNAVQEVDKSRIPPEALVIGTPLEGTDPTGHPINARVSEIKEKTVILDLNHPLAGKTLFFDVKILDIQAQNKSDSQDLPK